MLDPDVDTPAVLGGTPLFVGPPSWPPVDDEIVSVLRAMGDDGSWSCYRGLHGDRLVEQLREWHDCEYVLLCSSGRAAIELALRGLGVEATHEVVMAAYDFHANLSCIHQVGATPVLLDVRGDDAQLDVAQVELAITSSTKAIVASHLHGGVVDMNRLRTLADERNIGLVEDACQASGAMVQGRPAGRWGDVGVLSFGGSKLLTAGRGGALLTDRADIVQRIRRYLRGDNHAYPLSEMQAAVLMPQLDRLAERHQQRARSVAAIYDVLRDVDGVRPFVKLAGSSPAFYKLGMFYDVASFDGLSRNRFVSALQKEGLAIDAGFAALHTTHSRRRFRPIGELTNATRAGDGIIGLHHPVLLDQSVDWTQLRVAIERVRRSASTLMTADVSDQTE